MADKFVQKGGFDQIGLVGDEGAFGQNDVFCRGWVSRKKSPINVATVAQIRIVRILGRYICTYNYHVYYIQYIIYCIYDSGRPATTFVNELFLL